MSCFVLQVFQDDIHNLKEIRLLAQRSKETWK